MMGEKDTRSSTPTGTRGNGEIQDSSSRRELLDMDMDGEQSSSSWRLDVKQFTVPQQRPPSDHHLLHHRFRRLLRYPSKTPTHPLTSLSLFYFSFSFLSACVDAIHFFILFFCAVFCIIRFFLCLFIFFESPAITTYQNSFDSHFFTL
ncbi:hypothetical protein CsSME_00017868 [Camellia sinensis var. sinensis]